MRWAIFLVMGFVSLAPPARGALIDDLGGPAGVERIVSGLLQGSLADPRIASAFEDTNIDRLRGLLTAQLCELAGGPCHYTGRSMQASHAGLGLHERDFHALVENLQDAMEAEGVPFRSQNRLLALLAPMYRDVVPR